MKDTERWNYGKPPPSGVGSSCVCVTGGLEECLCLWATGSGGMCQSGSRPAAPRTQQVPLAGGHLQTRPPRHTLSPPVITRAGALLATGEPWERENKVGKSQPHKGLTHVREQQQGSASRRRAQIEKLPMFLCLNSTSQRKPSTSCVLHWNDTAIVNPCD